MLFFVVFFTQDNVIVTDGTSKCGPYSHFECNLGSSRNFKILILGCTDIE